MMLIYQGLRVVHVDVLPWYFPKYSGVLQYKIFCANPNLDVAMTIVLRSTRPGVHYVAAFSARCVPHRRGRHYDSASVKMSYDFTKSACTILNTLRYHVHKL